MGAKQCVHSPSSLAEKRLEHAAASVSATLAYDATEQSFTFQELKAYYDCRDYRRCSAAYNPHGDARSQWIALYARFLVRRRMMPPGAEHVLIDVGAGHLRPKRCVSIPLSLQQSVLMQLS